LVLALAALGQTIPQKVLVIRNVQLPDRAQKTRQKVDVLIIGQKIVRLETGADIPADAIIIDGGGMVLTLNADGSIKLTQDAPTAPQTPLESESVAASSKNVPADSVNFKQSSLEKPNDSLGANLRFPPPVNSTTREISKPMENQQAQQQQPAGNLAQDVTDPTAPLTTITFQNRYVPSIWGIDDDLNEFSLQVALPYKLGGKGQIFRAIIPYLTNTPSPGRNNGVGDVALANITLLPQKWGTFAVGGVISLGTNKGPGVDTFAVGPAVGAITKRGKFLFGFLNQNLFSFGGDIKITQIQPIVSYTLNKKVSFAIGDAQTTIDWNQKKFVSVPLSFQVNYIAMLGKQPIRLFLNPQYSPVNNFGQRKWTVGGGFALLLR
jgi:hypothetical protein